MTETAYRRLSRRESDGVLDWAAAEGWNPGRGDADAFWAADPEGFWGIDLHGELVGAGVAAAYGPSQGFMGLYLVREDVRHHGLGGPFGRFLLESLRSRLVPDASISLDGVYAMRPFYAANGFEFTHRNLRMSGVPVHVTAPDPGLDELSPADLDEVAVLDTEYFGAPRREFLRRWLPPVGGRAVGARRAGRLVAYGAIRPCRVGWKVGPLFASDPDTAESVFSALVASAEGAEVALDTPECNEDAVALAERHGLVEGFGCARMVLGPIPATPWDRIYGVTTFELG